MKSILKDENGKDSATRAIPIAFSAVGIFRLFVMTILGQAMGAPDAVFLSVCMLAVPLSKLFNGRDGAKLAGKLLDRLGVGAAGPNASIEAVAMLHGRHEHDPGA